MGAFANMIGVGCIVGVGFAVSDFVSSGTSARAPVGPPVLPDDVLSSIPAPPRPKPRTVSFRVARDGHYHLPVIANGVGLTFLVDTGATGVVLCRREAQGVGLDVARLNFDGGSRLADNSIVGTATARLDRLSVGPLTVAGMPVLILDVEACEPLLGMTFLRRMEKVSFGNGTLTLSGEP